MHLPEINKKEMWPTFSSFSFLLPSVLPFLLPLLPSVFLSCKGSTDAGHPQPSGTVFMTQLYPESYELCG